jgi:5-methylcytosine-specific restriction protein A
MNPTIPQFTERLVADRIGLPVVATPQQDADGEYLDISLVQDHPASSFLVRFRPGWRSAEAAFVPGTFAAPLLAQMAAASAESRRTFSAFTSVIAANKLRLSFRVNGSDLGPSPDAAWPNQWSACELIVRTPPMVVTPADIAQMHSLISGTVLPLFGMLAALIGVTEVAPEPGSALEGTPTQSLITRYERKQLNRTACIALKGTTCVVCGFDFAARYGALGVGYIEVHHTTPVSTMGPDYAIDVATELEPLCANCHAMAHREEPPVTIERLRFTVTQSGRP